MPSITPPLKPTADLDTPSRWSRLSFGIPAVLILAAAVPRLLMFVLAWHRPEACLLPDSTGYLMLAKNLAFFHVFAQGDPGSFIAETFRLPGYPLFLAPFIFLPSATLWVSFVQCVIGCITVFLVWSWLRPMADERGAMAGALVVALDLVVLLHTPMLLSETLATFLEVVAIIKTFQLLRYPNTKDSAVCGLLWGVSMMVKPVFLYLPLVLAWILISRKRSFLVFLTAAYLIPAGWVVRNGLQADFWGLSSVTGLALLKYPAANIQADFTGKSWEITKTELLAQVDAEHPGGYKNVAEQNAAYHNAAMRIFKEHPVLLAKDSLIGAARILAGTGSSLWFIYFPGRFEFHHEWSVRALLRQMRDQLIRYPILLPIQAAYGVALLGIYVLTICGWIILWHGGHRWEAWILAGGALYLLMVASHEGYSRFRIPMMPFIAGAVAVAYPVLFWPNRKNKRI